MGKYILLFRGSDVYQPNQSSEALLALKQKMVDWVMDLSTKGLHVASEPFEATGKQVSGARKIITDGPFGVVKERMGGCTIVLAKDVDEAVEIAKACPILETNATIEVRPIQSS